jgi:ribosomal protein L28
MISHTKKPRTKRSWAANINLNHDRSVISSLNHATSIAFDLSS